MSDHRAHLQITTELRTEQEICDEPEFASKWEKQVNNLTPKVMMVGKVAYANKAEHPAAKKGAPATLCF